MVLKAFTEFTEQPLAVQYEPDGKIYRIPPATIEAVALIKAIALDIDAAVTLAEGKPADWLPRLVLGDELWEELIADKVPAKFADRVYLAALADAQTGRAEAERIFQEGVDPLAVRAIAEARLAQSASKPSPRTGGATATRSRASSKATTSRVRRPS